MKNTHFGIFALSTVALLAVAGVSQAIQTKAAETDSYGIIGAFPDNNWSSDYATSTWDGTDHVIECTIGAGVQFKIRTAGTWSGSVNVGGDLASRYSDLFTSSSGNAVTKAAGNYTFKIKDAIATYGDKSYGIIVSYTDATEYTVSEYAVVDGVVESDAMKEETATAGVNFTPYTPYRKGYNFGGWYTDVSCETAYVATALESDTNLYAKFTTDAEPQKVYFGNNDWENVYVYSYGGNSAFGAWPGVKLTSSDLIIMVHIGTLDLYEVEIPSGMTDGFIIFNNGVGGTGNQTQNFTYQANAYYYYAGEAGEGSASYGQACAFLKELNDARNAAADYSICAIPEAKRAELLTKYNNLSSEVRDVVDAATIYTWTGAEKDSETFITVRAIMEQFGALQDGGSKAHIFGLGTNNDNSVLLIAIATLTIAATLGATVYYTKRRKHN